MSSQNWRFWPPLSFLVVYFLCKIGNFWPLPPSLMRRHSLWTAPNYIILALLDFCNLLESIELQLQHPKFPKPLIPQFVWTSRSNSKKCIECRIDFVSFEITIRLFYENCSSCLRFLRLSIFIWHVIVNGSPYFTVDYQSVSFQNWISKLK